MFHEGSRRGLQDRDSQHGDGLTDARTEKASEIELAALQIGSRVVVITVGRDVQEKRLCAWPNLGGRWIMASPGGALVDVLTNHLVALRDVTGRQTYPMEAEQIDQFELPVRGCDLRNWERQGQEAAAVISSRDNLPESGCDWEGRTLSLQDGVVRAAFPRIVGKTTLVQSFLLNRH